MTVNTGDPVVDVLDKEGLESSIFLSLNVLQVICVNHTNYMIELVGPSLAMMIPV